MKKVFLVIAILLSGFIAINMPVKIYAKDCGGVQVADKANCPGEFTVPGDGEGSLKDSVKKALSAIFGILGIIHFLVCLGFGCLKNVLQILMLGYLNLLVFLWMLCNFIRNVF